MMATHCTSLFTHVSLCTNRYAGYGGGGHGIGHNFPVLVTKADLVHRAAFLLIMVLLMENQPASISDGTIMTSNMIYTLME
jgi:hypothetical protein